MNRQIIMEPETITLEQVLKEDNQEIKRVMLERFGYGKLLLELKAKQIHKDKFGALFETSRLGEYLQGEDKVARFVRVKDPSTDREYMLRVPPDMQTARNAVAWTFDIKPEAYAPQQET